MMDNEQIRNDYFEWLCNLVVGKRYGDISYRKLLTYLHDTEFTWIIPKDSNRAADGISLRYRYAVSKSNKYLADCLDGACSILEMMVALSTRCEDIMDDPEVGDRTAQWFWGMIVNLGLGSSIDNNFDIRYVDEVIYEFLNREYEPNGIGGLFTVRNCKRDLRDVEIWYQLCWYLDNIV